MSSAKKLVSSYGMQEIVYKGHTLKLYRKWFLPDIDLFKVVGKTIDALAGVLGLSSGVLGSPPWWLAYKR